jgi:hypothetical protein
VRWLPYATATNIPASGAQQTPRQLPAPILVWLVQVTPSGLVIQLAAEAWSPTAQKRRSFGDQHTSRIAPAGAEMLPELPAFQLIPF